MSTTHRVIVDTDIGDDIDDAFCLAFLLKATEHFSSVFIKTCYGDPNRRLRPARAMMRAAYDAGLAGDHRNVGVSSGVDDSLEMPKGYGKIGTRYLYGDTLPADFYYPSTFGLYPGDQIDAALSIGPLTNLALSIREDQTAMAKLRHVVMAGEFVKPGFIEHNVRCDVPAAAKAFASGIAIEVIPWSIGPMTKLVDSDIVRIMKAGSTGDAICRLLVDWLMEFWGTVPGKTNMYDPMTAVALLHPEWFEWKTGRVSVDTSRSDTRGLTTIVADSEGPHRIATRVDVANAKGLLLDTLCCKVGGSA
ncbi:MAG: nucleoside hydrolase [Planctomycetota bacterium]